MIYILLTSINSLLYLSNIQLNFISFKFIIQISHLLRTKEIITPIKKNYHDNQNSSQNFNVILTKIIIETKEIKYRFYNNLLLKKLVGTFKFITM